MNPESARPGGALRTCFPLLLALLTVGPCCIAQSPAQAAQVTIGVIGDYGSAYLGGAST